MEIHSSLRDLKMVIYIIIHRPTGFCYVGQTSHKLKKRIVQHLRGKKQFVDKIIRIEGRDKFEVGVLDVCTSLAQLREREHHWIVYFNCKCPHGFNMTDGGEDNGKNNGRNKPVICLDTGEKFNSVIDAAEHFNICPSGISGVCHGRKKTVGSLRFAFADSKIDVGEPFLIKSNGKPRRVICIDTGEIFESIVSAAKKLNINRRTIGDVCSGKKGRACGLKFAFADIPIEERKVFSYKNRRRIFCLNSGEVFDSLADAARKTGINRTSIRNVCIGKIKSTHGLRFAFADAFK